eukprot:5109938-Amphidinium_carterae.1
MRLVGNLARFMCTHLPLPHPQALATTTTSTPTTATRPVIPLHAAVPARCLHHDPFTTMCTFRDQPFLCETSPRLQIAVTSPWLRCPYYLCSVSDIYTSLVVLAYTTCTFLFGHLMTRRRLRSPLVPTTC